MRNLNRTALLLCLMLGTGLAQTQPTNQPTNQPPVAITTVTAEYLNPISMIPESLKELTGELRLETVPTLGATPNGTFHTPGNTVSAQRNEQLRLNWTIHNPGTKRLTYVPDLTTVDASGQHRTAGVTWKPNLLINGAPPERSLKIEPGQTLQLTFVIRVPFTAPDVQYFDLVLRHNPDDNYNTPIEYPNANTPLDISGTDYMYSLVDIDNVQQVNISGAREPSDISHLDDMSPINMTISGGQSATVTGGESFTQTLTLRSTNPIPLKSQNLSLDITSLGHTYYGRNNSSYMCETYLPSGYYSPIPAGPQYLYRMEVQFVNSNNQVTDTLPESSVYENCIATKNMLDDRPLLQNESIRFIITQLTTPSSSAYNDIRVATATTLTYLTVEMITPVLDSDGQPVLDESGTPRQFRERERSNDIAASILLPSTDPETPVPTAAPEIKNIIHQCRELFNCIAGTTTYNTTINSSGNAPGGGRILQGQPLRIISMARTAYNSPRKKPILGIKFTSPSNLYCPQVGIRVLSTSEQGTRTPLNSALLWRIDAGTWTSDVTSLLPITGEQTLQVGIDSNNNGNIDNEDLMPQLTEMNMAALCVSPLPANVRTGDEVTPLPIQRNDSLAGTWDRP